MLGYFVLEYYNKKVEGYIKGEIWKYLIYMVDVIGDRGEWNFLDESI